MVILLETKADNSLENSFGAVGYCLHKNLIEGKMFPLGRWQELLLEESCSFLFLDKFMRGDQSLRKMVCFVLLVLGAPLPSLKWHSVCSGPSTAPLQTGVLCVCFQSSKRNPQILQAELRPWSSPDQLQSIPTCSQSSACSAMPTFCCSWPLMVRSRLLSSYAVTTAFPFLSVLCWGSNWLELF